MEIFPNSKIEKSSLSIQGIFRAYMHPFSEIGIQKQENVGIGTYVLYCICILGKTAAVPSCR